MAGHPDPNFPLRPQSKFPWPLTAIVVAALVLAAFIYYLPREPKRGPNSTAAETPQQPLDQTIQIKDLKLQPSPTGSGNVYLQGNVANMGANKINEIAVVARFHDKAGNVIHQDTVPMQALPKNTAGTVAVSFAEDPLKPDSSREFRLAFTDVPTNWNHEVPQIEIAHLGFSGEPPAAVQGNSNGVQAGAPQNPLPASDIPENQGKPSPGHPKTSRSRHPPRPKP